MNKKWIITGLSCVFLLFSGISYSCAYQKATPVLITTTGENSAPVTEQTDGQEPSDTGKNVEADNTSASEQTEVTAYYYVHICGAVQNPGVYRIEAGARLVDLIGLCGGLLAEAAGDYINQASTVADGQRIYIPSSDELTDLTTSEYLAGEQGASLKLTDSTLININTADREALMSLSGIGQAKADQIIAYRTSNGKFQSIQDLMNIPGIKEGLFGQISSCITVD